MLTYHVEVYVNEPVSMKLPGEIDLSFKYSIALFVFFFLSPSAPEGNIYLLFL